MAGSNLARATVNLAELRKFGPAGREAVDDFLSGQAIEPALNAVPVALLQGFLKQLMQELR